MGFLTSKKSRGARHERLPLHEPKDRDSNESYVDSDYDDDYSSSAASSPRHSRAAAAVPAPPTAAKAFENTSTKSPLLLFRLPNRISRYLCFGLASFMILLIVSLVRASQNDNLRIAEGLSGKMTPPPPIWESYDFLQRYYGGIRNLVPLSQNVREYPRPKDEAPLDKLVFMNETAESFGPESRSLPASKDFNNYPRSVFQNKQEQIKECYVDAAGTVRVPPVRYYDGRPSGFPDNVLGSYELMDLPEDICTERYGKFGPYGFGYAREQGGLGNQDDGDREGAEMTWKKTPPVDWSSVNWADAQQRCFRANSARYKPVASKTPAPNGFYIDSKLSDDALSTRGLGLDGFANALTGGGSSSTEKETTSSGKKTPRTAIVIRCWDEYNWKDEDVMSLRSVISELSLASGGRYDIHLLVQVKNDAANPIWADHEIYQRRIEESIPAEFRGLVTLWTETQMLALYQGIFDTFARGPGLPIHGVYRGLEMALQHFAYNHPEYDYFWQWEMDIRYTGHYYDLFTKVENWAKTQPRKGLWERNARFYVPSVHGTWEDFKQMARVQTEMGTLSADNIWNNVPGSKGSPTVTKGDKFVWGPERPWDREDWFEIENDPKPPGGISYEEDKYEWGVGEEAEYIAFNPMYDPEGTTWGLRDDITGYNLEQGKPPRRAQIITASRMSRRLLMMMHRETAFKKKHAFPEMWPGTVALQHGYKAVFAPHPLYVDREWPTAVFEKTLNNGKDGAAGGARTAVFGDREHNLRGLTWFYDTGFSGNLYRRWLGLSSNNDGGPDFERSVDPNKNQTSVSDMRGGEGRMCLPPMLLHPVKDIDLPMIPEEQEQTSSEDIGSDPFA